MLAEELDRLELFVGHRIAAHFETGEDTGEPLTATEIFGAPARGDDGYGDFLTGRQFDVTTRIILILSLAPMLRPEALDAFLIRNSVLDRGFTEFGGIAPKEQGFLPTVETALFLLAGRDLHLRFKVAALLDRDGPLVSEGVIDLKEQENRGPMSRLLQPGRVLRLAIGQEHLIAARPAAGFAAHRMQTPLTWDDLVVPLAAGRALDEICNWARHRERMRHPSGPFRLIGPGFRSLFYGPPGTGKTLAATLLGQRVSREVYRVDLSMIVSKWIGETEKNLSAIFAEAERNDWILFFDEADALFGKRTEVNSANDRYANQEVAYVLQRIEVFDGLVILASNLKSNIDTAFARRFQSVVHFPAPDSRGRLLLWQKAFAGSDWLGADVDLTMLSDTYATTGAMIVNILQSALLAAVSNDQRQLTRADLMLAIDREFRKEVRVMERGR